MSEDRSGRELTPREPGAEGGDSALVPIPEADSRAVERFSAGPKAHMVGLTEERGAQIVRQSGNARNVVFLAVLIISLFIPVYWFYENGIPALGAEGRLAREKEVQLVTDVERGYELYQANCAQCHGADGQGGVGPPLNDPAKLYNAIAEDGSPGSGHLNPNYITTVLTVGGRYVCGDANSIMQAWREPNGPLNYRQVEELVAWITASRDIVFEYEPSAHGAAAGTPPPGGEEGPVTVRGWRDPAWTPAPGATPPPACWRNPSGQIGGAAPAASGGEAAAIEPGTPDDPRIIGIQATASLTFTTAEGEPLSEIAVVPGETVAFHVDNVAGFDHNFYIGTEEQLTVANGTTDTGIPTWSSGVQELTWTVPEGDGLMFACTLPGHEATMHGDITFQEAGDGAAPAGSPEAAASAAPAGSPEAADASTAPAASPAATAAASAEAG